jgi:hypothetical protein
VRRRARRLDRDGTSDEARHAQKCIDTRLKARDQNGGRQQQQPSRCRSVAGDMTFTLKIERPDGSVVGEDEDDHSLPSPAEFAAPELEKYD